jgi:hypothetical protein
MISHLRRLGHTSLALPAALILCLLPAAVRAETINLKNGTPLVVVVQASAVSPSTGRVQRDAPSKLAPGDTATTMLPGNKVITIVDPANPNKPLCQKGIASGTEDLYFEIVIVGKGANARVTLEQVPAPKKP